MALSPDTMKRERNYCVRCRTLAIHRVRIYFTTTRRTKMMPVCYNCYRIIKKKNGEILNGERKE